MRAIAITLAAIGVAAMLTGNGAEARPKHCPPGHAKKGWCTPGGRYALPPGLRYRHWDRWRDAGLRRPRAGEIYVIVDGEAFLILEATREVLEALGAVTRLLD